MDFSTERLSYEKDELLESVLPKSADILLKEWIHQAVDNKVTEPYAMSLATCGSDNLPSVRIVLMREVRQREEGEFSIVFYTNYDSAKGQDMAENPNVQALFFWQALERQVRLSGQVRRLSIAESTQYFHKRPHDSQIAAWVSEPQSGVVANREVMEQKFAELKQTYMNGSEVVEIPKPDFWGGYELVVSHVEFWQGRANRMHDRIVYQYNKDSENNDDKWLIQRLLP